MNLFLHNPTGLKVHVSAALGTFGLLVLLLQHFIPARARKQKRDIYKPSVLLSAIHGQDDVEDSKAGQAARSLVNRAAAALWRPGLLVTALNVLCIVATVFAYLLAVRGYTALTNWQDGHEREFIGDPIGAIICYKKALRADPTLFQTHLLIGKALYGSGRVRSALPELMAAAKGEESDPEAASTLGDAYQALNMPAEAIAAYRRASAIAPGAAGYQLVLRVCLEKLNRWNLAMAFVHAGMNAESAAEFRAEIAIDPQYAAAYFNLGNALKDMHDIHGAVNAYRTYLRVSANQPNTQAGVIRALTEIKKLSSKR